MKLNLTHWGWPSTPCTLLMSPKAKFHLGKASVAASRVCQGAPGCPPLPLRAGGCLSTGLSSELEVCAGAAGILHPIFVFPWEGAVIYLDRILSRNHHGALSKSMLQAGRALIFALLNVGKQCGSPRLLSRTGEPICSQKCKFPWEVHVWQLRGGISVDKTADFRSIKAFKKDHSTWLKKLEGNGLSAPLWLWDFWLLSGHPFWLKWPLLSRMCSTALQPLVRNSSAFLVCWWATSLFHSNNVDFSISHLQKSKNSHTYCLAAAP